MQDIPSVVILSGETRFVLRIAFRSRRIPTFAYYARLLAPRFEIFEALMARVKRPLACAVICRLGALDVEIHDDWVLPASDDHCFTRHIRAGVNFLMRDVRRNINEISRRCLIAEL